MPDHKNERDEENGDGQGIEVVKSPRMLSIAYFL